ncbi:MAG: helix-turn-helix transcriptional regulator [Hyphomicrobiales bacterium]|nr:helix-turn-helix transcriptional regulator [Hyphomicrobiales bacterium]
MSTALAVCHGAFGRVTVYRLDRPMRTHAHREGHLTFLLSGTPATVTISDVPHLVDQSEGVAINPWQPHSFHPGIGSEPSIFLVAYICDRWLDHDQQGRGGRRFGANRIEMGTTIRSIAASLAHVLVTNASYRLVERYLNQLFDASFDASWRKRESLTASSPSRMGIDFRVRKSLRLIDDGFVKGIEFDALARDVGLSRPHFFKLFRENTGVTPGLYANTMRVERALERLTDSRTSVTDIGFELGFSSQSHFTHFFASHVGIPPTLYRSVARIMSE